MKTILIYNPFAGRKNQQKTINSIELFFKEKGLHLDIYKSEAVGSINKFGATRAIAYDNIILMGGDGSLNELASGLMEIPKKDRPKILLIPAGTSNDFSKIIKLPKSLNKKLELLINDNFRYVDITKFNEKYFLYVSAYGYLTEVSYETEREKKIKYGYLAYLYYIIKNFKKKRGFDVSITIGNKSYLIDNGIILLMLKKNQFGSRKFRRFSKSSKSPKLNDGEISIGVVKRRKDSFYSKMIKFMTRGGFLRRDDLYLKISECTLKVVDDSTRPYYFNFDGERGHIPNVEEHIKVIKEAIPFFIDPKHYKELFTES